MQQEASNLLCRLPLAKAPVDIGLPITAAPTRWFNATSVHSLSIGVVASYQHRLCLCQTTDSYYGLVNLRSNQHTSTIQAQPRPSNASINATQPPCTKFILSYTHPPPHRLTSPWHVASTFKCISRRHRGSQYRVIYKNGGEEAFSGLAVTRLLHWCRWTHQPSSKLQCPLVIKGVLQQPPVILLS